MLSDISPKFLHAVSRGICTEKVIYLHLEVKNDLQDLAGPYFSRYFLFLQLKPLLSPACYFTFVQENTPKINLLQVSFKSFRVRMIDLQQ